jgi:hypothetical protein
MMSLAMVACFVIVAFQKILLCHTMMSGEAWAGQQKLVLQARDPWGMGLESDDALSNRRRNAAMVATFALVSKFKE